MIEICCPPTVLIASAILRTMFGVPAPLRLLTRKSPRRPDAGGWMVSLMCGMACWMDKAMDGMIGGLILSMMGGMVGSLVLGMMDDALGGLMLGLDRRADG